MLKKGYDLSDQQIDEEYRKIARKITMPAYFYPTVSKIIGKFKDKKIIDIGCGNGYLLSQIAQNNADNNITIYGLDNCKELVKSARSRLDGKATIIHANANRPLPLKDNSFDVVVSTEVIEHLKNPNLCLREINRILKKSGIAYITVPNGSAFMPFQEIVEKLPQNSLVTQFIHGEHPIKTPQPIATVYFYKEIIGLLTRNNLIIQKVIGFESFPYFFNSCKYLFGRLRLKRFVWLTWEVQFSCDKVIGKLFPAAFYRLLFVLKPRNNMQVR